MSFRKERKFRLTSSDAKELRAKLSNKGMMLLHPNRKITSQYFDTPDLQAFSDSEEGVLPRFKIRVRWYNDDQSVLTFERKVSAVEGRFKTVRRIQKANFDKICKAGFLDRDYGRTIPSVEISYERSYFQYENLRITFDTNIRYCFPQSVRQYRDFEEVVEIKAPMIISDDYLEQVVPVPASRFSKYARSFLHAEHAI
jgi:hypothetical protein